MQTNEICMQVIRTIRNYLHDPDCLSPHRKEKCFVRKRSLSMLQVIQFLFYSSKASMCQNLASIISDFPDIDFPKVSKQAVSKARQGIKPSLFRELFNLSVDVFYKNVNERKLWNNYHIFAIDGTKLELPNSKSNFEIFGEMFTTTSKERRYFTQALGSMVYDVMDDYIVHASIHPYLSSERSAALAHLQTLEALDIYTNSIVIFDRGYYSEALFRYCVDHGHLCVMRLKESMNIEKKVMVIPVSSLKVILTMIQMTLKSALLKLLLMTVQRNILLLTLTILISSPICSRSYTSCAGRSNVNTMSSRKGWISSLSMVLHQSLSCRNFILTCLYLISQLL